MDRGDFFEDWRLESTSMEPHLASAEEAVIAANGLRRSPVPCPACGSGKTLLLADRCETHGTNISGFSEYRIESRCSECGTCAIFAAVDSFGPTS